MSYHEPVLLDASLDLLITREDGIYTDATFGGGGHSARLIERTGEKVRLYAFDQDADAAKNAQRSPFSDTPGFCFIASNFRFLKKQLRVEGVRAGEVDGILADLGVSSYQFDTAERGFSYRFDGPLDMRMNQEGAESAADVLNAYSAERLQQVFGELGEVRNARTLAQACVQYRRQAPFSRVSELIQVCESVLIGERWKYLSQAFQALRMEVNDEVGALCDFLRDAQEMLRPGGRLVVISYHSIEDRIVKNFLKSGNPEGIPAQDFYGRIERPFEVLTKKAIAPGTQEIQQNPRARSAKLRAGARTGAGPESRKQA